MSFNSLIDAHLEQIAACAQTIAELNFPKPKIFANALLKQHDITTLIRDTEAHERALFTVPKPEPNRRSTVFPATNGLPGAPTGPHAVRGPRRNTAVAAVLGGDLVEKIKRGGGGGAGSALGYREGGGRDKGDIDVEVLLEGAEKLVGVYPLPGAMEQINSLRQRHARLKSSIAHYEARAADQADQLHKLRPKNYDDEDIDVNIDDQEASSEVFTQADMQREEQEVQDLERKKRSLEERVNRIDQDLHYT